MFGGGRDGIKTAMIWALCHSTQHLGSGQIQLTRKHHSRRYPQKCSMWWSRYSLQVNAKRLPSMTLPFSLCLHLSFYHKTTARKHSLTPFSTCLDLTKRGKDWSYKKFSHLLCTVPVHLLFLFFFYFIFMYLKGEGKQRQRRERAHMFKCALHLLVYSSSDWNKGWVRFPMCKAGTQVFLPSPVASQGVH